MNIRQDVDDIDRCASEAQRYLDISSVHCGTGETERQRHFEAIGAAKAELRKLRSILSRISWRAA